MQERFAPWMSPEALCAANAFDRGGTVKRNPGQALRNSSAARRPAAVAWGEPDESAGSNEDMRRLRALTVLEHLTESTHPLTLARLATLMNVPKSSLMRLLQSMEAAGYVLHMPADRGFVPGARSVALGLKTLRGSNIRRECRAVLRRLVAHTGETCNLTVPDAGRVLYMERIETAEPLRMHVQPGTWVPIHCTASGKLFLASMSLLDRNSVLANYELTRHSHRTIVDRDELERELQLIAKTQVGTDNEEFIRGMIAVAVPVVGLDGRLVASIACHAPTARRSMDDLRGNVPQMRAAAESIRSILFPDEKAD